LDFKPDETPCLDVLESVCVVSNMHAGKCWGAYTVSQASSVDADKDISSYMLNHC